MVVATGFFDGVHLGHRHVLSILVGAARERGTESIVATFWPHPRTVLQDEARGLRLLSSLDEKKALLAAAGVDRVEVIPFSRAFSEMTAEAYLREYVIGRLGATAIVVGYDNRLGSDRCTPDRIRETGEKNFEFEKTADIPEGESGAAKRFFNSDIITASVTASTSTSTIHTPL